MRDLGYRNAINLEGGFAGVVDPAGQVLQEGWATLGFPIERGDGGEHGYHALRARAHLDLRSTND